MNIMRALKKLLVQHGCNCLERVLQGHLGDKIHNQRKQYTGILYFGGSSSGDLIWGEEITRILSGILFLGPGITPGILFSMLVFCLMDPDFLRRNLRRVGQVAYNKIAVSSRCP